MMITILLATLTIILSFYIPNLAKKYGVAVSDRFLERGTTIPPTNEPITATTLRQWVEAPENKNALRGYVFPVLALDFIFLLCLGGFLGWASLVLAGFLGVRWPLAIFGILPLLYLLSDLCEDVIIIILLRNPNFICDATVRGMRALTAAKLLTIKLSLAEVLCLCFAALIQ